MLPNFIIIGANKAGTTSLYHYLSQHPEIFMSRIKEPMYFTFKDASESEKLSNNSNLNIWLKDTTYTLEDYMDLFKNSEGYIARGEASTSYINNYKAADEIHSLLPDIKIIAILREPISRAISNYKMHVDWGMEYQSFKDAIKDELKNRSKNEWQYLKKGLYASPVEYYLERFPQNQIKIYLFEEFTNNTEAILKDIFLFLGVNPFFKVNTTRIHNTSSITKNYNKNNFKVFVEKYVPEQIENKIKKYFDKISESAPGVIRSIIKPEKSNNFLKSKKLILKLKKYYEEDINKLELLINKDLSHWKNRYVW